jgi:hypothetical protein
MRSTIDKAPTLYALLLFVFPLSYRSKIIWLTIEVVMPPIRHISAHERLEDFAMVWHTQVKQLMRDYEVLKVDGLFGEIVRNRDDSECRTGPPFSGHSLDPNDTRRRS